MAENKDMKSEHPERPDVEAAPPDDGGHQGSFTRPQDMLQEPLPGSPREAAGQGAERPPAPDLQYVNRPWYGRGSRAPGVALLAVLVGAVLLLILFMYAYYSPD